MIKAIKDLKLIKTAKGKFVISGYCDAPNDTFILVNIYEENIIRAQTVARVLDSQMYSPYELTLDRGLYSVGLQECIDLQTNKLAEEIKPGLTVMAGESYPIEISCEETNMYGHFGLKVTICSSEKALGNKEIYYKVSKAGDIYRQIRYWVPMNSNNELEFFIAEVGITEIIFEGAQPGIYAIKMHT